jgi:hypothetical protein
MCTGGGTATPEERPHAFRITRPAPSPFPFGPVPGPFILTRPSPPPHPSAPQPVLSSAAIECLALLMDRLSLVCTCLRDMPRGGGGIRDGDGRGGAPLALALLFHSAACCVRRQLQAMSHCLGVPDVELVRQYGETLVQVGAGTAPGWLAVGVLRGAD